MIILEKSVQLSELLELEKTRYLSHTPCDLFSTVNSRQVAYYKASPEVCDKFLYFFVDKIASIRASIPPPSSGLLVTTECTALLSGILWLH